VRDCAAKDIEVISVPGPSAVISALAVSGLATDRFCFEGFLPRKSGERQRAFEDLIDERRTMIFFEAPHRILDSLEDASKVFGSNRRGSVSRELTKKFEHTERGSLDDLIAWAKTEPKGEMVLVIEGAKPKVFDIRELGRQALELAATGVGLKQACNEIAQATGASKSAIYAEALSLKA
jgi:16S rRNA (cytidine1402-2'-O)-methyltransferase